MSILLQFPENVVNISAATSRNILDKMNLYIPTSFGQLIKVGEKEEEEEEDCRNTSGAILPDQDSDSRYFQLIIWELDKQLEIHTRRLADAERLNQTDESEETAAPAFRWLTEFVTPKTSITPILYQLIEKRCNELLPQYAEGVLRKFRATDFSGVPLEDIPWTLLSIIRDHKLKQDQYNASVSAQPNMVSRIENWLGWSAQLGRGRARIAPSTAAVDRSLLDDISVSIISDPHDFQMTPEALRDDRDVEKSAADESADKPNKRRSLLSLKGRDYPFRKLSASSRRYSTLSDDSAQALFVVNSTSSEDFKEISLNTSDTDASADEATVRDKMRSRIKQFKDGAVSIIDNFRHGRKYDSNIPL